VKSTKIWRSPVCGTVKFTGYFQTPLNLFFYFPGVAAFLMDCGSHLPRFGASKSFPIPGHWLTTITLRNPVRPPYFTRFFVIYVPAEIKNCFVVCEFFDTDSFCACLWYLTHNAVLIYPKLEKFETQAVYERFLDWKMCICVYWNKWIQLFLVCEKKI
jgi:hypothetical protein